MQLNDISYYLICYQEKYTMSKEQKSNKLEKKQAVMTPKEKKAAKRAKEESKDFLKNEKVH